MMGYARKRVKEELLAKSRKVLNHPELSDEWYRWPWAKKDIRLTKEYADFLKYKAYLEEKTAEWIAAGHDLKTYAPYQALCDRFTRNVLLPLERKEAAINAYNEKHSDILLELDNWNIIPPEENHGSEIVEPALSAV